MAESTEQAREEKVRGILLRNREIYEDTVADCTDPARAVQPLYEIAIIDQNLQRGTITVELPPEAHLAALDQTEKWYKDRNYAYPFPERLQEQRQHWQGKLKDQSKT